MRNLNLKKKGFTLIEITVVLAIISVLAGMLTPSLCGYVRKSKRTAIVAETKIIYNAASDGLISEVANGEYQLLTDKEFNGKYCGCITNWIIGRAQLDDIDSIATDNMIDYMIAKDILSALESEKKEGNFYKFNGLKNNPCSYTLERFESQFPNCSGLIILYGENGDIIRIEYSKDDMLCVYDGDYTVYNDDDSAAKFSSVQYDAR